MGTAIMQPLVGWAIDRAHSNLVMLPNTVKEYQSGLAILLGFSVLGLLATFFIKETYCRYVVEN